MLFYIPSTNPSNFRENQIAASQQKAFQILRPIDGLCLVFSFGVHG